MVEIRRLYDDEYDIMGVWFGKKVEHSEEFFDGDLIIDFDEKDKIVGFEIFGFEKQRDKFDDKFKKMIEKSGKS